MNKQQNSSTLIEKNKQHICDIKTIIDRQIYWIMESYIYRTREAILIVCVCIFLYPGKYDLTRINDIHEIWAR